MLVATDEATVTAKEADRIRGNRILEYVAVATVKVQPPVVCTLNKTDVVYFQEEMY